MCVLPFSACNNASRGFQVNHIPKGNGPQNDLYTDPARYVIAAAIGPAVDHLDHLYDLDSINNIDNRSYTKCSRFDSCRSYRTCCR